MPFPLTFIPAQGWHHVPRSFGAPRSKGKRKHAGCDLYAPVGTPVHAVADGKITIHRPFYLGTFATVIDHGDFVVRYGEVQKALAGGLKVGDEVAAGQVIGSVGKLSGLNISMIHFEMFSGTVNGELTTTKSPFFRRADLMDPTAQLDAWAQQPLPT
ncbi:hypothetical protein B6S44_01680 [Bosea sp. Tri-44]|uniref:M23 family metallopeptidase n=1 Tax=Bosea sp. Tri-44 TaxID=1972137 RepID=UPI00100DA80A|nr:M23 family metallopeptidase [Bosea sp. Tri-44]RXT57176.1 hypothetical protein B6S44_01680 [Bosea sp. Tri-44]